MKVLVRPFATIREVVGVPQGEHLEPVPVDLPAGSRVLDLLAAFSLESEPGIVAISEGRVLSGDSLLADGQEVALFPLLAGG